MIDKVITLEQALVFPALNQFRGATPFTFGVESSKPDDDPPTFGMTRYGQSRTNKKRRQEIKAAGSPAVIAGRHLYAGPVSWHFGHLLADCVHRLWACRHMQGNVDSIIFLPDREAVSEQFMAVAKMFRVDPAKMNFVSDISQVETLIVPEAGYILGRPHNPWYQAELADAIDLRKYKRHDMPKSVFISRRHFRFVGRVAGSDYVASRLAEDGYFEVCPERYPLADQIAFLVSADRIIFEEGSACHLLDILPPLKTKAALLRRRDTTTWYDETIMTKTDGSIYSDVELLEGTRPAHNRMSRFRHPAQLFRWLHQNGFTRGPTFDQTMFFTAEAADMARYFERESGGTALSKYIRDLVLNGKAQTSPERPSARQQVRDIARRLRSMLKN